MVVSFVLDRNPVSESATGTVQEFYARCPQAVVRERRYLADSANLPTGSETALRHNGAAPFGRWQGRVA